MMFEERRNGASLPWLGRKYKKHHTTILFHCRKFGIVPETDVIPTHAPKRARSQILYAIPDEPVLEPIEEAMLTLDDGPINRGKRYVDYVKDAMKQREFRHYFAQYNVDPTSERYMHYYHPVRISHV